MMDQRPAPATVALLLDYAMDALDPAASLLVATHIAMSGSGLATVSLWRAAADIAAEHAALAAAPAPMRAGGLDAVLSRLEDAPLPPSTPSVRPFDPSHLPKRGWRRFVPGLQFYKLPLPQAPHPPGTRLRLFRLAPGFTIPTHAHGGGEEVTLVLQGAFSDESGRYAAGDLFVMDDEDTTHTPRACLREGCTCLTLTRGPFVFKSLAARVLGALL
ncbi:MAG TPA: hypothetical protein DDX54_02775 [Rhodospirillaceae bacterium]|jgi:putative transcriptional regulator|nr:cupin domain-containing protein [Alphaproteobacteria bacterium]HBH26308.1 hypothetical protein [Rhodospirillaceae bacterium]